MKRTAIVLAAVAPFLAFSAAASAPAFAESGTMYHATLDAQNHQDGASGTVTLTLNGNSAVITEHTSGLAGKFMDAPFPHVQHIHGGAKGTCPPASADKNGDAVVSTSEGIGFYGPILTTLSVSGGTTPADGVNIKIAPSGASFDYSRTIMLDDKSVAALKAGTAVVVVHGDDPTLLSAKAQAAKSELPGTEALPLAATAPALCGALKAMPAGGAATGGGSTSGTQDSGLAVAGALALLGAGGVLVSRKRASVVR